MDNQNIKQNIWNKLIEPKKQISEKRKIFSNTSLKKLIIPLFFEQMLVMLVGIVDTLVVSYVGEAAVSGVALVNMFNTIFIYLFTALASGGSVVISQYIGKKDKENSDISAGQLMTVSILFSLAIVLIVLIFDRQLLQILFGKVDDDVMEACIIYLRISACSYVFLAIYNTGAALYRSIGKTNITMNISIISNIINGIGSLIGIFILHAGVAGVAYPSLLARIFSAVAITVLCFKNKNDVSLRINQIINWNATMIKRILKIAVPNGIENGLFQLAKVALSSIIALFGTSQIAANGVAQSFWSMAALIGVAMGPAFITVIGQCMGAEDFEAADYYMKKLMKITFIASIVWNALILVIVPYAMKLYALPDDTVRLVIILVIIHNVFNTVLFPLSGPLSYGLRAAGDVKFTMYVSIFATVICRVFLSVVFAIWMNLGVIGITLAMCFDWGIRALIFTKRYKSGKWKIFKVI